MVKVDRAGLGQAVLRGAIGAVTGAALGGLLWWLLIEVPLGPPPLLERLRIIAPTIVGCLSTLGVLFGVWGRVVFTAADEVLLPRDLAPEARRLYLLAGLIVGLAVLQYHISAFLLRDPTDLPSFIFAARAMAAGRDFYDPEVIRTFADETMGDRTVFPYLYLPLYAVLLRPLSMLPLASGTAVFLVVNALLWPLSVYLCLRLIDVPHRLRAAMTALVLIVYPGFLPTVQTFHHGSPSLLVAVLVVAVLICAREDRPRLGGVLLGFVILIKVVPVLLIPYLLLRRSNRLVLWSVVAMGALLSLSVLVAGLGPHLHWFSEMAPNLAHGARTGTFFEPGCHPENQALTGLWCRFLGATSPHFRWLSSASGLVLLVVTAFVLWRRRRPEVDRLEGSLVVVSLMLVSTITWFHHMTLMLLPLLTLIVIGSSGGWRGAKVVLGIGIAALIVVGFEFYLDPWPFVAPNPVIRIVRFDAMLVSWVTLLVLVSRSGRDQSVES